MHGGKIANSGGEPRSRVDAVLASAHAFVDEWLLRALPPRESPPRRLHNAMHDAVFPGGRRARPILCRLVADRLGQGDDELIGRFAAALELVHCAAQVQIDLPYFEDAATRRGLPAIHATYGKATAILVGDALLTLAFETLANAPAEHAPIMFQLMGLLGAATGGSHGLIGGQARALEQHVDPARHKATALYRAAAAGAAVICGVEADVQRWARVGELVGMLLGRGDERGRTRRAREQGDETGAALRQLLGAGTLESEAVQRLAE